ncbi:hypothetical protein SNE40_009640 [Patella caerulea]|uniref:Uncharacterized protein n=1 Tax=Patella caerulea TaxID=87958 RepID=A0AAN8JP32_PATCE
MARGQQQKNVQRHCGKCAVKRKSKNGIIFCDTCLKWYQIDCKGITDVELKALSASPETYICEICRNSGNKFDYLLGITRLGKAANHSFDKLRSVAEKKMLIHKERHVDLSPSIVPRKFLVDEVANKLLRQYTNERNVNAVKSTGDGDCLFNVVSTLLIGCESLSVELRYRTCLEMVLNETNIKNHVYRSSFALLSPDYKETSLSCATIGRFPVFGQL